MTGLAALNFAEIEQHAIAQRKDIFVVAASRRYGVPESAVTKEERNNAKQAMYLYMYSAERSKVNAK